MKEDTKQMIFNFFSRILSRKFILSVIGFFMFVDLKKAGKLDDWPFFALMLICIFGDKALRVIKDIKAGKK